MIAALYVAKGGCYFGLPDVDPWDEARDARLYAGPWPVVAHPPCARWCRLAGFVESRYPSKRRGEDGGTFAAALASVRRWGGVLEHPAYSDAWRAFDLLEPPTGGGWVRGLDGGWSCYVEQIAYGHRARKPTWLYLVGSPVSLRWGYTDPADAPTILGRLHVTSTGRAQGVGRVRLQRDGRDKASSATPPAFRDALLDLARRSSPRPPTTPAPEPQPASTSPGASEDR